MSAVCQRVPLSTHQPLATALVSGRSKASAFQLWDGLLTHPASIMLPDGGTAEDDDYVAAILKRDAQHRLDPKYPLLTGATSSFASKRGSNLPKPNTRFLRNVIRDTDQHNAQLKAREESESRARLKALETGRRACARGRTESSKKEGVHGERKGRWNAVLSGLGETTMPLTKQSFKEAKNRSQRHDKKQKDESSAGRKRRHDNDEEHSFRDFVRHSRRRLSHSDRSASPQRKLRHYNLSRCPTSTLQSRGRTSADIADGSYEGSVGPLPETSVRSRGRGNVGSSADIDNHFDPKYDPREDTGRDDTNDLLEDWADSVETNKTRPLWQRVGAKRLLEAGFTQEEISRWKKGDEKDVDDVKWMSKDETREWDRGKTTGKDGNIELKASWITSKKQ